MTSAPALPTASPLLSLRGLDATDHLDRLGPLPDLDWRALASLAETSGLTGRGGAGFPAGTKLRSVASARGRAVVIGNAMEGEPLSGKDAALLDLVPHLVLDGLILVSRALRARRVILAVGPDVPAGEATRLAADRKIEVRRMGGGFVAGQESALVRQVEGRPAVPADPLVRVSTRGVAGHPTLVSNIETLAQLALVARGGAGWFRSYGTEDDPGTSLFTISGSVTHPGVVEAERGSRLVDVLTPAAPVDPAAVLVGGYHGSWVPASSLDVRLTRTSLAPYGASVGAGVLHVLDRHACPLRFAAGVATYLAGEVVGQCGPCVNGLPRMADSLTRLASGSADGRLVAEIGRLQLLVTGRGACAHPDGTARFVASTLNTFADHVDAHLRGLCPAVPR